jgi:hypothetical protein
MSLFVCPHACRCFLSKQLPFSFATNNNYELLSTVRAFHSSHFRQGPVDIILWSRSCQATSQPLILISKQCVITYVVP